MDQSDDEKVLVPFAQDFPNNETKAQRHFTHRKKWTTIWALGNGGLLLLAVLVSMSIGLIFPKNLDFSVTEAHLNLDPNTTTSLLGTLTVNASVFNHNFVQIQINALYATVLAGPIPIGTLELLKPVSLTPRQGVELTFLARIALNPVDFISHITNRVYQKLVEAFILEFAASFANGDVLLKIDGPCSVTVAGLTLNVSISQMVPVSVSNITSQLFSDNGNDSGASQKALGSSTSPPPSLDNGNDSGAFLNALEPPESPSSSPPAVGFFLLNFGVGIFLFLLTIACFFCSRFLHNRVQMEIQKVPFVDDTHSVPTNFDSYEIAFRNIGLKVGTKPILEDVSGVFRPGRVTAIMGPSGCGKTSLLNVLSGRAQYGKCTGDVFVNGRRAPISNWKRDFGFVPQEDVMHRELSVEDILFHSAFSRLPENCSWEEAASRVEEVISILDLTRIRNSIIGDEDKRGISGGQRKRVNIAIELVANPGVIFLDEPTSGLDSSSSVKVIALLSQLAQRGLTIVTVIHQPRNEIFQLIDDIVLLGLGGQPVFVGPTKSVQEHFANHGFVCPPLMNPSDFFLDVIAGTVPEAENSDAMVEQPNRLYEAKKKYPSLSVQHMNGSVLEESSQNEYGDSSYDDLTPCQKLQQKWKAIVVNEPIYHFPAAQDHKEPIEAGTFAGFIMGFVMNLIFPFLSIVYFFRKDRRPFHEQFGEVFGVIVSLFCWKMAIIYFFGRTHSESSYEMVLISSCVIAIEGSFAFLGCLSLYLDRIWRAKMKPPLFSRLFFIGCMIGPLSFFFSFFVLKNRKSSSALYAGFFFEAAHWIVFSASAYYQAVGQYLVIIPSSFIISLFLLAQALTYVAHHLFLFHAERQISGFAYLAMLYAYREFKIQRTKWRELCLHFLQMMLGGLFLGFFFYNRPYQGPLVQPNTESGFVCPQELREDPIVGLPCVLISLPKDDPLGAMASLSVLTISLCAVSFAVPIFGREITIFSRESSTGASTGAYFFGKSLAQLPISMFVVFLFLTSFGGLAVLNAPWIYHYTTFLLTYLCWFGVGVIVSLLVPPLVSQLTAVFSVLITMMFSGANPTLPDLLKKYNNDFEGCLFFSQLLGRVLYYPTWVMLVFTFVGIIEQLFNYVPTDQIWCYCAMIVLVLLWRITAYLILFFKFK